MPDPIAEIKSAISDIDWEQVRLNGGPPCFHVERGRRTDSRIAGFESRF